MGAVLLLALVSCSGGGGGDGAGGSEATGAEVMLESVGSVTADPFTESILVGDSTSAHGLRAASQKAEPGPVIEGAAAAALARPAEGTLRTVDVTGSEPGLYGGTRQRGECDPEQLVAFLESNPDKANAWAEVHGIDPARIAQYVDGLTPVVLRRDTLVTNHGYRNGRAIPKQSVLQAGTAVLVDAFGVPRVKCECGNPLAEPSPPTTSPSYRGAAWPGFSSERVVEVVAGTESSTLVLVDTATQETFTRPVGSSGTADGAAAAGETCDRFPKDPACTVTTTQPAVTTSSPPATTSAPAATTTAPATSAPVTTTSTTTTVPPTTTFVPTGGPVELFTVYSALGVQSGPTVPSVFTFTTATYVSVVRTYHYLSGGAAPGTITLRTSDGMVYGPYQATGAEAQGGVPNAYWDAAVGAVLPAGEYTIEDSDPSTWSIAGDTGGRGICWVYGFVVGEV